MKTIDEEPTGMQALNELSNSIVQTRLQNLQALDQMTERMYAVLGVLDSARQMFYRSFVRKQLPNHCVPYKDEKEIVDLLASFGLKTADCLYFRNKYDLVVIGDDPLREVGDELQSQSLPRNSNFSNRSVAQADLTASEIRSMTAETGQSR